MKNERFLRMRQNSRFVPGGFTLIEMLIVIVIFSILAAISYVGVKENLPRWRLNAAARLMRGDLVDIKSRAVRDMREYRIRFTSTNSYVMEIGNARASSTAWQGPTARPELRLFNRTFADDQGSGGDDISFPGVSIDTVNSTSPIFRSNGILQPGLGNIQIRLTNNKGDAKTISVTMAGRIRID